MDITLIICTCNRAEQLSKLFVNLEKLIIPAGISWEIIIVDNASQDETSDIIHQAVAHKQIPIIALYEPVKGKSRALNLALNHARGQLLVFTDDDLDFTPEWIAVYYAASLTYPQVDGFLGRVLPLWENAKQPRWCEGQVSPSPIDGIINRTDHGEKEFFLKEGMSPGGCNAALRKKAVSKMGKFREDMGPGTKFPFAEDTEFFKRLYSSGGKYLYLPDALVYHRNVSHRMTRKYFLKWIFHCSRSEVQINKYDGMKTIGKVPIFLFRKLITDFFQLLFISKRHYLLKSLRPLVKDVGEIIGHLQKKS